MKFPKPHAQERYVNANALEMLIKRELRKIILEEMFQHAVKKEKGVYHSYSDMGEISARLVTDYYDYLKGQPQWQKAP